MLIWSLTKHYSLTTVHDSRFLGLRGLGSHGKITGEVTVARTKKDVLAMIERLPDEASLEDIMAELYFRMQVDAGLAELDSGRGLSQETMEKKISEWSNE